MNRCGICDSNQGPLVVCADCYNKKCNELDRLYELLNKQIEINGELRKQLIGLTPREGYYNRQD